MGAEASTNAAKPTGCLMRGTIGKRAAPRFTLNSAATARRSTAPANAPRIQGAEAFPALHRRSDRRVDSRPRTTETQESLLFAKDNLQTAAF